MIVPVVIYLAINAGRDCAAGWGGGDVDGHRVRPRAAGAGRPRLPDRLRAFLLTVVVVDDLVALVVIATVYSEHVALVPLLAALGIFARDPARCARAADPQRRSSTPCSASRRGSRSWSPASTRSWSAWRWGCWPTPTRPPRSTSSGRRDLFRLFREQPTPELARSAQRRAAPRRSRPTSACSSSTTRGRAT